MGHIVKTPAGTFRANWRDPAGRQKSKTFPTKREASLFLAEIRTALARGTYIDPDAGKVKFEAYALAWLNGRNDEATTAAGDASVMRCHIIVKWGPLPLAHIDHSAVQAWVAGLSARLAPATIRTCFRLFSSVLRAAVRDRLIAFNPCEGVRLPRLRRTDTDGQTISREALISDLLPVMPDRYRALVGLAAGTGLRWGECVGLRWDALDLDGAEVRVVRVAVEVAGHVTAKPYPKSKAGRRTVPLPPFVVQLLTEHAQRFPAGPTGEVFVNTAGGPMRRTLFRARVWRPALVRAGLLGKVVEIGPDKFKATWPDKTGMEWSAEFTTERDAVAHVARKAVGGLRFHDLRHSYATWLVSDGVPVNDVQRVMGHEQASTTLDRYTHSSRDRDQRVLGAFADFSLIAED
jgi:integrase